MNTRTPHLKHIQIIRLGRLMDMLYRPAELAEEISIDVDTIYRSYIPAGMPCIREGQGHIWVHGLSFAAWAKETVAKRQNERSPLADGYGWCLRCNQAVKMVNPSIKIINRYLELEQAPCPNCGGTVNRGRRRS